MRKVYAKFLLAIGEYSATLGIIDEAICLIVEQEGEEDIYLSRTDLLFLHAVIFLRLNIEI